MGFHFGVIDADPSIQQKLREKHGVTLGDVIEALQWPSRALAAEEDHPQHGWRVVAYGRTATGRELMAVLLPAREWEGIAADTWIVKTARWLDAK